MPYIQLGRQPFWLQMCSHITGAQYTTIGTVGYADGTGSDYLEDTR